jgi:hypothetical protein
VIAILWVYALWTPFSQTCLVRIFPYSWVADLALDSNTDYQVRVNFNITMMDLRCEWAVVDTVSVLGTDQNITAHVTKWQVDGEGVRRRFQGRNRQQADIAMFDGAVTSTIDELHEDGEDAVSLDTVTFPFALMEFTYLFVDFYASWCSHVSHVSLLACEDFCVLFSLLSVSFWRIQRVFRRTCSKLHSAAIWPQLGKPWPKS